MDQEQLLLNANEKRMNKIATSADLKLDYSNFVRDNAQIDNIMREKEKVLNI